MINFYIKLQKTHVLGGILLCDMFPIFGPNLTKLILNILYKFNNNNNKIICIINEMLLLLNYFAKNPVVSLKFCYSTTYCYRFFSLLPVFQSIKGSILYETYLKTYFTILVIKILPKMIIFYTKLQKTHIFRGHPAVRFISLFWSKFDKISN